MKSKIIAILLCLVVLISGVLVFLYKDSQNLANRNNGEDLIAILDEMACSSKEYCWYATNHRELFTVNCEKKLAAIFNATDFDSLKQNLCTIEANSYMTYQGPPCSVVVDGSSSLYVDDNRFLRIAKVKFNDHELRVIQMGKVEGNQIDDLTILRTTSDIEFSWMDVTGWNNEYFMIPDNPLIEEMYGEY